MTNYLVTLTGPAGHPILPDDDLSYLEKDLRDRPEFAASVAARSFLSDPRLRIIVEVDAGSQGEAVAMAEAGAKCVLVDARSEVLRAHADVEFAAEVRVNA